MRFLRRKRKWLVVAEGDVLILKTDRPVTEEEAFEMRRVVRERGLDALILSDAVSLVGVKK